MIETLTRLFRRRPAPNLPIISPADPKKVTPEQRKQLAAWLDDPVTGTALALVEGLQPTVFVPNHASVEWNRFAAERRTHQLQGWVSYRNSLLALRHTPEEIKAIIEENFPSAE